ncbi:translation elongation factor Ts [Chlamydiales bacterium]|nr:translation elongation factor Ts [Chlamydiales bacterium]
MTVTVEMIQTLRKKTGVGMGKCKEALVETSGNVEDAVDWLRKKGIASAVKKEGRDANEGIIGVVETDEIIAFAEVNSETDFVANNANFQKFVKDIAEEVAATNPESLEAFLQQKFSKDSNLSVDEFRATFVQSIGENIQVKRVKTFLKGSNKSLGFYSHMNGKIVTLVEIEGTDSEESLCKEIAMQVAASNPDYLNPESIPEDIINREKEISKEQVKGKPENIMDKILAGKLNAYYDQSCLVRQKFIKDDSLTIDQLVQKRSKELGKPLQVTSFCRWALGQKG